MSIALYVHFPFCLSICPYCDFDRQATGFDRIDVYVECVLHELQRFGQPREPVHSIFFGGGTPSLMSAAHVAAILTQARQTFAVQDDAEITLECNPGDADFEKLTAFRRAGANRLSFGVQSLDDAYLKLLGRRHSADEARQAAEWARRAGFAFNLDFMFGLPEQSLDHWDATLEQATALVPDHLSCYLLTLDERVQMGRDVARGRLVLPEDDALVEMYQRTRALLASKGYEQYEISNWARPGQASRHNLTYWHDGEWLGVGAGAASAYGGRRWKNTPVLERYIASVERGLPAERVEDELPDAATAILDFLTLGLRLREGVSVQRFAERFGRDLFALCGDELRWLEAGGALEIDLTEGRIRVAAEHQLVTNEILVRLEDALERALPPAPSRVVVPPAGQNRRDTSVSQIAAR